jgi:uncharacterized membrane protein YidH (DUF202 family)
MLLFLGIFFNMITQVPGYGPSVEYIIILLVTGVILLIVGGIILGIGLAKYQEEKKKRRKLRPRARKDIDQYLRDQI